jgi:hypothetical protein
MKKLTRRKFIYASSLIPVTLSNAKIIDVFLPAESTSEIIAAATWSFGKTAVDKAVEVMNSGGSSLDGVVAGANIIEADADNSSV